MVKNTDNLIPLNICKDVVVTDEYPSFLIPSNIAINEFFRLDFLNFSVSKEGLLQNWDK